MAKPTSDKQGAFTSLKFSIFRNLIQILASPINNFNPKRSFFEEPHLRTHQFPFVFNDSIDSDLVLRDVGMSPVKPWTQDEKSTILALVSQLSHCAPGLLRLASIGSPINLLRICRLVLGNKSEPIAFSGQRTILLPDAFFFSYGQIHNFAHEITHIADDMELAAFSKQWLEIAAPVLQEYRVNPQSIKDEAFSKTWPSEYACHSVIEALAEYVAAFVNGRYFASKVKFEETVAPLIISPTPMVNEWKVLVEKARQAKNAKNYIQARLYYRKASKLFPENPRTYFQLAGIATTTADYCEIVKNTQKMIEAFEVVDSSRLLYPTMRDCILQILKTYIQTQEFSGADKYAHWLLKRFPNDTTILELEKYCQNKLLNSVE